MKKTLFFVLSLFLAATAWATINYDFSAVSNGRTLYYKIINDTNHTVMVTYPEYYHYHESGYSYTTYYSGHSKPTGELIIPSAVTNGGITYTVISVGPYAFYECTDLTSVVIPATVTNINSYSFHDCNGMRFVSIPSSVENIYCDAFSDCTGLNYVDFPDTAALINWCSGILSTNEYSPVKYAHNIAINGSVVTNLVIPNTVTSIANYTFYGCSGLASVTIPSSITSIGVDAFYGCNGLVTVNFPDTSALINWCNVSLGNYTSNPIYYSHQISINDEIITNLILPNSVTTIRKNVFRGCSGLASVSLPNTVVSIEDSAFFGCSGLSSFTIPNSVSSINKATFNGCSGLSSVFLGGGLTSLHVSSFANCTSLDTVYSLANWPPSIVGGTNSRFGSCGHLVSKLVVPCGREGFYSSWSSYFSQTDCESVYAVTTQSNNSNWGVTTGSGNYFQSMSSIQLKAIPNHGYHFVQWNDSVTASTRTVQLVSDTTFIAYFSPNQYTITVGSGNPSMGTVTGGGTYDYGSTITLVATAQEHYHLDHWSDGNTDNPRVLTVSSDSNLVAYFTLDQFALTVNTNNPEWGTVTGEGTYDHGSVVTITATPVDNHRHFIGWNDGNTSATRTITLVSDTSFTAYFDCDQYTVTVTSAEPSMGFVTGDGTYDYGSTATVTAHPHSGFQFLYWNDGSTDTTRNLIVTQDMTLVAYFGQQQGIDDVENDGIISLYPNPASEQVSLQLQGQNSTYILSVTDQLGREVLRRQLQGGRCTFPVSDWPSGTYFVIVTTLDGSTIVQKLLVR